jgi:hypothetical protein
LPQLQPPRTSTAGNAAIAACLAALVALYVGHALSYWHYVNDDAYITFRYSANLAQGHGPYYNDGERVEGYTNALLMILIGGAVFAGGDGAAAPAAKALGVACGVACVLFAFALARASWPASRSRSGRDAASLMAAGLLAVIPGFALNSTSGLETTLFGACIGAGVLLGLRSRGAFPASGLAFALAALTRPEGAAVFAVFWLARLGALTSRVLRRGGWRGTWLEARRSGLVADAVVVALTVGAHLALRWYTYDGEFLPNTFHAKIGGFEKISPLAYVRHGALAPFLGVAGVVLALAGLALGRAPFAAGLPLLVASTFGVAEPLWAASDWMPGGRLVAPYLPLVAAWVAAGWCLLVSAARPLARIGPVTLLATLPLHWTLQDRERQALLSETIVRAQGYATGHRALGQWLASGAARSGDTIALMDIGIAGYTAQRQRVLDLTGLTDRFIAQSPGRFLRKDYDPRYVLEQHPDFVVVVLTGPGRAYQAPPLGLALRPWTPAESALMEHPDFRRWYARPRLPRPLERWPQDYAAVIGAERVFEHAHPGVLYLLAVFRRQSEPAP